MTNETCEALKQAHHYDEVVRLKSDDEIRKTLDLCYRVASNDFSEDMCYVKVRNLPGRIKRVLQSDLIFNEQTSTQ